MQNALARSLPLGVIFVSFLAACVTAGQPQARPSITPATATIIPSPTSVATAPAVVTPDQPRSVVKVAVTPLPGAPLKAISPAVRICSPLADHQLNELSAIISDPYHPPPMGKDDRHQGVDFSYYRQAGRATIEGEGVQSVLAGRVAAAIRDSFPFGNLVIIETKNGGLPGDLLQMLKPAEGQSLYLLYAHLAEPPLVQPGDPVQACQALGVVGKSGNAGVAHLHLETRFGPADTVIAGMAYYTPKASRQERDNYVLWRMSGRFRPFDPMILLEYFLEPG
jgi:murein DD-endopeptidase MepM/ murein hydrolase activator NlpD